MQVKINGNSSSQSNDSNACSVLYTRNGRDSTISNGCGSPRNNGVSSPLTTNGPQSNNHHSLNNNNSNKKELNGGRGVSPLSAST